MSPFCCFRLLHLLALLLSPVVVCPTLVGYDVDNVLSTKVYSLLPSDQCAPERMRTRNITYGGLVLHAPEVDIELPYCMFQASYTVSDLAHSARFDDSMYISGKSRLIPTYYPLDTWTCRSIWQNQEFKLPGFSDNIYILKKRGFYGQFPGYPAW